jgi:predicted secreted protein
MSIIVNNTDGQLNINSNGVLDVYSVRSIKSVSRGFDASGNYYIAINFIANDKNNSLRIYLNDVISPVSWTNTLAGANAALADIRDWLGEIIDVQITEANDSIQIYASDGSNNVPVLVGNQSSSDSIAVALAKDQYEQIVTPFIQIESGTTGSIGINVWSISFASNGTANANVSFDGGSSYRAIPPGTTINMDAGIFNWYYQSGIFYWNTTAPGASLIITYNG